MIYNNIHEKAFDIHVPICLVHGDSDTTVLVEQSIVTDSLLPNSELHIFQWTDHRFKNHWEEEQVNKLFTNYFLQHLWNQ